MNLYEINHHLQRLLDQAYHEAEDNEGEIDFDLGLKIDEIQLDRTEKLSNVILAYKNLRSDEEQLKQEKERLEKRRKTIQRKIESLKTYLTDNLVENEQLEDPRFKLSWRKSTSVEITDMDVLDDVFKRISYTPDKDAIKKNLKNGFIVEGAELKEKNNWSVQ